MSDLSDLNDFADRVLLGAQSVLGVTMAPRKRTTRQSPSRSRAAEGWVITPRTIGVIATIIGILVALWSPIQGIARLPQSIDNLAIAVQKLQTAYDGLDTRVNTLESEDKKLNAMDEDRLRQLQNHESRIGTLEQHR